MLLILGIIIGFIVGYCIGIRKHTYTQKSGDFSEQIQIHNYESQESEVNK